MSHFTVLVVVDPKTTLEEQLAPFQEFECTGKEGPHVQEVDLTEEVLEKYGTEMRVQYQSPDGKRMNPYGDEFYRDPTPEEAEKLGIKDGRRVGSGWGFGISSFGKDWNDGRGYRTKVHFLPEGWTEVSVPTKEMTPLLEWIKDYHGYEVMKVQRTKKHKYGYVTLNADGSVKKVIQRTNPNAKWDWYSVGGRWTGFFKLKPGAEGEVGSPGLFTEPAEKGTADLIRKGDIDIEGMRNAAGEEASKRYLQFHSIVDGTGFKPFEKICDELVPGANSAEDLTDEQTAQVRKTYFDQPGYQALANDKDMSGTLWEVPELMKQTYEEYVQNARNRAIATFAVLKDGVWYERGKMDCWASVSNEMDREEWSVKFNELLDSLSDDTFLAIVDCHI